MQAPLNLSNAAMKSVSPFRELGAYEALWARPGATFKQVADLFRSNESALPSDLVPSKESDEMATRVVKRIRSKGVRQFGVRVHHAGEYPERLRDAAHPVELLYFRGSWDLVYSKCVAIVGTRNPTPEGIKRTRQLVSSLVEDDWTIVSGLAAGIDTAAHQAALDFGGRTIAVIGTPICDVYPRENSNLQERLAKDYLVISQVPVERYSQQDYRANRAFFPERNVTMSALSAATIIVEASDTSGTLIQARAALKQSRKLMILDSCFRNHKISWPAKFAEKGAIRIENYAQVREGLGDSSH